MSIVTSASFVYPWVGSGRITEPPGLAANVGEDWSRLQLAGDLGVDIPPETEVQLDTGRWCLPAEAVGKVVRTKLPTTTYVLNGVTLTQANAGLYKVISCSLLTEGEARVNQTGGTAYGGPSNESGVGVLTRAEAPPPLLEEFDNVIYDDGVPTVVRPTSGVNWAPSIVSPGDPVPNNEGQFVQQFTDDEVTELKAILEGVGGGGAVELGYQNVGTTTWTKGMPIYSPNTGQGDAALATGAARFVLGLCSNDTSVTPSATGNVTIEGSLSQVASGWQAITGEAGGLISGAKYYLDFTVPGKLTRLPDIDSAPANRYLVAVGYALNATTLQLEVTAGIRIS